ncbi:ArsR family transcriptional regulator [Pedobacter sp. MC2016-24]|uniref:ArsR family transcriptional regulator n=1 Tax=Pedobacter sp. MC2016-24 TaxID=2780090 RepID=UPI00188266D3|nr:ArsR family transcriptional regulator [Pedobacter sp. MC2016-24]MBE9599441.1 ArsR family transcriptional regulator [Pedobacter sp. MC2016-24]
MKTKMNTKPAKTCYNHIGGKLGELLLEMFVDQAWIQKNDPTDKYYVITEKGQTEFTKLGLDLSQITT